MHRVCNGAANVCRESLPFTLNKNQRLKPPCQQSKSPRVARLNQCPLAPPPPGEFLGKLVVCQAPLLQESMVSEPQLAWKTDSARFQKKKHKIPKHWNLIKRPSVLRFPFMCMSLILGKTRKRGVPFGFPLPLQNGHLPPKDRDPHRVFAPPRRPPRLNPSAVRPPRPPRPRPRPPGRPRPPQGPRLSWLRPPKPGQGGQRGDSRKPPTHEVHVRVKSGRMFGARANGLEKAYVHIGWNFSGRKSSPQTVGVRDLGRRRSFTFLERSSHSTNVGPRSLTRHLGVKSIPNTIPTKIPKLGYC